MNRCLTWSTTLLVALLVACAAPKPTATPGRTPVPAPTAAPPPPTLLPGEAPAQSPVDIAGVWFFQLRGQGGVVQSACDFTIREDGTYTIDHKGGMHIEKRTYTVNAGKLALESDECYRISTATFYHCVGTYMAYSRKEGTKPVLLRLVMVDDKGDRSLSLNNKTLELDAAPPSAVAPASTAGLSLQKVLGIWKLGRTLPF